VRLFLGVDPGDACRRRLARSIERIRTTASGVRWVAEDKLHVTLFFFGEVEDDRVERIQSSLQPLMRQHAPFTVDVTGSGVFPDWRRPRVVWFGLRDGGALVQLGREVHDRCTSLGFAADHPFRSHLTIGRVPQPLASEARDRLRKALSEQSESCPFDVSRVVLMRSQLSPRGSVYTEVGSFPLGGT
jgi:2'-5' RNA ligase